MYSAVAAVVVVVVDLLRAVYLIHASVLYLLLIWKCKKTTLIHSLSLDVCG